MLLSASLSIYLLTYLSISHQVIVSTVSPQTSSLPPSLSVDTTVLQKYTQTDQKPFLKTLYCINVCFYTCTFILALSQNNQLNY